MKLNLSKSFSSKCACPPEGLEIVVNSLAGELCSVFADCGCSVADVKELIAEKTGIPVPEQRLLASGCELGDTDKLSTVMTRPSRSAVELLALRRDSQQAKWLQIVSDAFDPRMLVDAPEDVRNDREVVLAAVRHSGDEIRHASEDLRADRDLAWVAVETGSADVIAWISPALQADRELILHAIEHSEVHFTGPLRHVPDELRRDKQLALVAVRKHGRNFFDVAQQLWSDPEVVLSTLQHNYMHVGGCACCGGISLSPQLFRNKDFILQVLSCYGDRDIEGLLSQLQSHAPETLEDRAFVLQLLPYISLNNDVSFSSSLKRLCSRGLLSRMDTATKTFACQSLTVQLQPEFGSIKDHSRNVREQRLRSETRHSVRTARTAKKLERGSCAKLLKPQQNRRTAYRKPGRCEAGTVLAAAEEAWVFRMKRGCM